MVLWRMIIFFIFLPRTKNLNKMKRKFFYFTAVAVIGMGAYSFCKYNGNVGTGLSELEMENVEALAEYNEGPTAVGCKSLKDASCLVFDSQGILVYTGKNKYPGK